jgi:hypothetical protein
MLFTPCASRLFLTEQEYGRGKKHRSAPETDDNSILPDFHESYHVMTDPDPKPGPGGSILAKVSHEMPFRKYR